jgi:hypothetical protein
MESGKYRNESIKTRVRPIKKLCIIENNDFPRLIEIIRIYSKEICGILNLILINDATLFSSNILEFIKSHDPVVKNYTVGIKYVSFICYPTRDSNGEKRAKAQVQ